MKAPVLGLSLALLLVASGGCASAGGTGGDTDDGEGPAVAVRVANNVFPSSSVTIWLVSQSGFRNALGNVLPNRVKLLEADRVRSLGRYTLVAERTGGRDIVSRTFYLNQSTSVIEWDLRRNTVVVVDN
jgi:hypothetical protein